MKILWHSNAPWVGTGYGVQTAAFAPRIRDAGHDVAISCFWGLAGAVQVYDGLTCYPGDDDFGNKWLAAYTAHHGEGDPFAPVIITLMDVWVLDTKYLRDLKVASWVPVDHDPLPPKVAAYFHETGAVPIAMAPFGVRTLQAAGLDPLYVPHGIDTQTLVPMDRREVRRAMNEGMPTESQIPEDAFVVGMVAANKGANPSRKAFPQVFEAFKRLHRLHPDAILYLHTTKKPDGGPGLNLPALADLFSIPREAIRWTPDFELQLGVPAEKMPFVFNAFDVLAAPSYGEGFGVPIVEAQACGIPVIVNDFSAPTDMVGAGWKIGGTPFYDEGQGSFYQAPDVGELTDAMVAAYDAQGDEQLRAAAREFAVRFDVETVMSEYWTPALAEIERRTADKGPRHALTDVPNRAARRRASRGKVAA